MATVLRGAWEEPTPRTQVEKERLALLNRWALSLGEDTPRFQRQEVMMLAGLNDSDWRWLEYNKFVEGTVPEGETYRHYSVKEIRAIRLALRMKRANARRTKRLSPKALSNLIKLEVNMFLNRPPIQTVLPLNLAESLSIVQAAKDQIATQA